MKKFVKTLLFGKYSSLSFAALSAVAVLFNYAFRFSYVFIDTVLFNGFSMILFTLAVISTVFLSVAASLKLQQKPVSEKKAFRAVQCICQIYTVIFSIIVIVSYLTSDGQTCSVGFKLCRQALPFWSAIVCIGFAAVILPYLSKSKAKRIISSVIAAILVVIIGTSLFPVSPYKFTSGTAVFDNGEDYSVVFSTSDKGTAYIEYEYDGQTHKVFDENNGRKNGDSIIHTVHVPYEHLSQNTYKVGSTRVIDELSYGGRLGKTIESESIKFNDNLGDNVTALTVSDWHSYVSKAENTISHLGDYNAVLLLGDSAPGLMVPEETEEYIVKFAADLSKGSMPVIFARGNHETRGREACKLADYLGMDKFYFTAKLGNYNFVVLDSGEDKKDDHPEYGGMVAYEQNRKEMVSWLESLESSDGKTIALSHSDEICIEEDLSEKAHAKLNELNVSLLVSGHLHESEFRNNTPYPTLIDGGINAVGKGTYVASKLTITNKGIEILSIDSNGQNVIEEKVEWR